MENRKNLAVVALVTICLLAVCFSVTRTRSSINEYDPWLDYNEDGVINMRDIAAGCASFMAEGDPTKNVNVMNWPQPETPLFYEILTLKPVSGVLWGGQNYTDETGSRSGGASLNYLIDENMAIPPGCQSDYSRMLSNGYPFPTTWTSWAESRYMGVRTAQSDYYIQGDVIVSFPLYTYLEATAVDRVYFNVTVYLQTVDTDNYITGTLANKTVTLEQGTTVLSEWKGRTYAVSGVVFSFTSPVMIHSGERLSIVFNAVARTQNACIYGSLYLYHNSTYDGEPTKFEVQVPILRA